MYNIAINFINSNSGGGKSIRDSFLRKLREDTKGNRYTIFVSKGTMDCEVGNDVIKVIEIPKLFCTSIASPIFYMFIFGILLKRHKAEIVLNFGDLIINTRRNQVYVFDWAYAVDVHPIVWRKMSWSDWINRRVKLYLMTTFFKYPRVVIAQTDYIRKRLIAKYKLENVAVVGNSVTLVEQVYRQKAVQKSAKDYKVIYPALNYPHKNFELILSAAKILQREHENICFLITINEEQKSSKKFLQEVRRMGLDDEIINLGTLDIEQVYSLYESCDVLIMPSLLESFSITYLEAMQFDLPILASDMWFAHSVCGDAACYFDPFNAQEAVNRLKQIVYDEPFRSSLIQSGRKRLKDFPSWDKNFEQYIQTLEIILTSKETY